MSRTCPHCGCSDIDEDATRGDSSCTNCGAVLEESIIVSENQFQERSGGSGHTLVGQFVPVERAQSHACVSGNGLVSQESREVTFAKGRKLIEEIASQLRINQRCVDTSYNFFKMCVSRNLTRGRIRSHVVAACLYMTCRLENTAHLLLDFSDVTQVNVFDLGRTLSFLSRSLRINLPSTDPCLYVMRFACLLELGDKQKEVVNLATRLVQRMKRDWMSTGRRPTGLCGAALLLAARSFNFNRSISDVVRVVHISESVVRKRLEEFSQTPSSALTIDEFSTVDLEHCEDPPAYRESRRKAREEQLAKEAEAAARMEKDVIPIEEELERALEKKRRERFKHTSYAKIVAGEIDDPEVGVAEEALLRDEVMDSVYRAADGDEEGRGTPDYRQYAPSLDSLGITQRPTSNNVPSLATAPLPPQDLPDGSLDLTGIDDDEIDTYILTSSESAMKERFWMKLNGEYIKEMERRRKEREEDKTKDNDNATKKKRRRVGPSAQNLTSGSAVEAMEKIIHEKRLSNKVNYDILKEITLTASGLEPVKQASNPQIIANVNNLVATLALDNTAVPVESNISLGAPLTRENMSRSERDIVRKNKPLKNPAALRVALKIEPTTPNDLSDSTPSGAKSIPTSRFVSCSATNSKRRIRVGSVKPNLSQASLRSNNASTPSTSHYGAPSITINGNDSHLTDDDETSEVKQHIADIKISSTQVHTDGGSVLKESPVPLVTISTTSGIDSNSKEVVSPSNRFPDVASPTNTETRPLSVPVSNTASSSGRTLSRGRRLLAKPRLLINDHKVVNGKEEAVSDQTASKSYEVNSTSSPRATRSQQSAITSPITDDSTQLEKALEVNECDSTLKTDHTGLKRRRRPYIKPCLPPSSEKRLDNTSISGDDSSKSASVGKKKVPRTSKQIDEHTVLNSRKPSASRRLLRSSMKR